MLPYATYAQYKRMRNIQVSDDTLGERNITEYLQRVTDYVEGVTHRAFYPVIQTRMFNVNVQYQDLRNRAMIFDDIMFDRDLSEVLTIQTKSTGNVATNTTLTATLDPFSNVLTVSTVSGLDATGVQAYTLYNLIQIGSEVMQIMAIDTSANTLTVIRAVNQTQPLTHTSGTAVFRMATNGLIVGNDYFLLDFNKTPYFGARLVYPNTWYGAYAVQSWQYRYPQIFITGFWGYRRDYWQRAWVYTNETIPVGNLTASATSFTATNVDGADANGTVRFEKGNLIRIDNELLWVTDVNLTTNVVTILRGKQGSIAVEHTAGTRIYRYQVQEEIQEVVLVTAKTFYESDNSQGGRQGVSEMSGGVEISIPKDQAEVLQRFRWESI